MIIITYRPLYCVFVLKHGIPSRKFLAPPLVMHLGGAMLMGSLNNGLFLFSTPVRPSGGWGGGTRVASGRRTRTARVVGIVTHARTNKSSSSKIRRVRPNGAFSDPSTHANET